MAALPESPQSRILGRVVDLRNIAPRDLVPVLEEEASAWRAELDWDLHASTSLVRRFVEMQALNGFALLDGQRVIGYAYYVCDEGKGLIGDLYILARDRTPERESALIEAVLTALWRVPGIRRVESQLLMLGPAAGFSKNRRPMPFPSCLREFPRLFLDMPAANALRLKPRETADIAIGPWLESRQDESARLVAAAYRGHIDSEINDQYRSPSGARRFLANIVQYPGCGTFFAPASYAATATAGHSQCGISLTSLVAADVGHITQICVTPSHRGTGLGYELLRCSLAALATYGCRTVSLTVTASNHSAIRLYESMGFVRRRRFAAHVWDLS